MDEKETDVKEEEKVSKDKTEDDGDVKDGDAPTEKRELSVLEQAESVHQKIKEENDRTEKLQNEKKELMAKQLLGGRAGGGVSAPVDSRTDDQKNKDFAEKVLSGESNPLKEDGFVS